MDGDATNQKVFVTAASIAAGRGLSEPKLSPSGEHVAFISTQSGERPKLCVVNVSTGGEEIITSEPGPVGVHPQGGGAFDWCPDGLGLVFVTKTGSVHWVSVDGSLTRVIVARQPVDGSVASPSVSPNGEFVAYTVDDRLVAHGDRSDTEGSDVPDKQTERPEQREQEQRTLGVPARHNRRVLVP